MRFIPTLFAYYATSVAAIGIALVVNNTPSPIYVWSVGGSIGARNDIRPGGGIYWERMHRDERSGGIAIKVTKTPDGLYSGAPQQIFAYNLEGEQVWYDLSSVFGEPFVGYEVKVEMDAGESIVWPNGTNPGGSRVKSASNEGNLFLFINPRS
ncbi:hypothetical protein BDW02DRAFT_493476 [Decorospora gaudefroyi]|uniref:BYS1 domain protein n=1 Tax=Decorospora gaudefroyi TaxID=184978 RepID=A0A6A5KLT4_9PLEO|nr:hypothetical protein BDW02DRAFT_493476 [Decorospora gaudefroyi]